MYRSLLASIKHCRQSPIDIPSEECVVDEKKCQESSFEFIYNQGDADYFEAQEGVCKIYASQSSSSTFTCSHLPGTYKLAQFHFHWGEDSSLGSEHQIDGHSFSGECHFVFWNTKYGSMDDAENHRDGLGREGEYNDGYSNITSLIRKALENNGIFKIPPFFDAAALLPISKFLKKASEI
ncbi:unnamed protein product [Caenorhabditis auriculariae]|uniref:Alpha-carbonic anhydrase domain-containing protein n=1 Tax=Caenorhabditis auriculariae TaxID=2777116 RepID=A0A8S1H6X5_9PELO|nr:unnamed protein product [Caenorhabditis auriculariae]